jgi:hypothetical protein
MQVECIHLPPGIRDERCGEVDLGSGECGVDITSDQPSASGAAVFKANLAMYLTYSCKLARLSRLGDMCHLSWIARLVF